MQGSVLIGIDRPGLTTPVERELRNRIAWEGVIAILLVITRAWDLRVERVDSVRLGSHERRARVDDRLEAGDGGLGADVRARARDLPEAGRLVDGVVLDRARVVRRVRAAEVELGAGGGEVEAEDALVDSALGNGSVEEGALERLL